MEMPRFKFCVHMEIHFQYPPLTPWSVPVVALSALRRAVAKAAARPPAAGLPAVCAAAAAPAAVCPPATTPAAMVVLVSEYPDLDQFSFSL